MSDVNSVSDVIRRDRYGRSAGTLTWAGIFKEKMTPSDHYRVDFTGVVSPQARLLTVMTAIVLDLTLYGPV